MHRQHAACRQDAACVIVGGVQLGSFGLTGAGRNGAITVRRDEALKGTVIHCQNGDQGAGLDLVLGGLRGAHKDIDLAIGQTLLLVCTAVIRNDGHLAALHGDQRTPGQVAVGQGVAAGHLDAAVLGLFQNGSQRLIRRGVDDPGTVVNGADGIHLIAVKVHFFGTELLAQIVAVAHAIAKDQQLFGNRGIVVCKVGCRGKAITASHVLHDEVVLLLELVCHLTVLARHDVCRAADTVGTDDLDGFAAVAGLLRCSRACGGRSSAACIGSGTACKQPGGSQNSAHGQKFATFHSSVLLQIFTFSCLAYIQVAIFAGVISPEAKAPK